ncbi:unnamed protein product [Amoebophrya sp. A25]|nr:unnamed protein product [Amoebophrya sp. A25]|eukprot:GSA25T00012715001.1
MKETQTRTPKTPQQQRHFAAALHASSLDLQRNEKQKLPSANTTALATTQERDRKSVFKDTPDFIPHWEKYDGAAGEKNMDKGRGSSSGWRGPSRDGQQIMSIFARNVRELDARRLLWKRHERLRKKGKEDAARVRLPEEQGEGASLPLSSGTGENVSPEFSQQQQEGIHTTIKKSKESITPTLRLLDSEEPSKEWRGHLNGDFPLPFEGSSPFFIDQPVNIIRDQNRMSVAVCQAVKEEETIFFYQLRELQDHLQHYTKYLLDGTSAQHLLQVLFPYFDLSRSDFGAKF